MTSTSDQEMAERPRLTRQPVVDVERGLMLRGGPLQAAMSQMGFSQLRDSQVAPIDSLLSGRDVLVVLPTSGGKTAIFVLPTLAAGYQTLVFSPLIALMRDQVMNLRDAGIKADYINSARTPQEITTILSDWVQGSIRLLYVAPERLNRPDFLSAMGCRAPDMVAVDECFTGDVEILTEKGFVRFDELEEGLRVLQVDADTGESSFVLPTKYIRKPYKGQMVRLHSKKLCDLTMTPQHQLLAVYANGWKKESVEHISMNSLKHFWAAAPVDTPHVAGLTPLDRLQIAYQADGNEHNSTKAGITAAFSFAKARKISRFLALVAEAGVCCNEVADHKDGRCRFIVQKVPGLSKDLRSWFRLDKMSAAYAAQFIDEVSRWDGSRISDTLLYYSSRVKENVDFVQAVAVLAGYKTNMIVQRDTRKASYFPMWRLFIQTDTREFGIQHLQREEFDYEGDVWCVRVPAGNIVVRRGGKPVVVGNCHCVSVWSDIFRHSYCFIGDFIERFRPKVVAAVTATCNEGIEKDVYRVLGLPQMSTIWNYYPRTNLSLFSRELNSLQDIVEEVKLVEGRVIIYFSTIDRLEKNAGLLSDALGETVGIYHGKLNRSLKDNLQDLFREGKIKVMAATSAFGMGVDIAAIRAVIHHDPPGTMESVSQEVGRAGRDDLPARCVSFYHEAGWRTQKGFIERGYPEEDKVRAVYKVLQREGAGGKVIKMTARDMAKAAGIPEFGSEAVLQLLMGHRVLKNLDHQDRTLVVGFLKDLDDDRFQSYKKAVIEGGHKEGPFYKVSLDYMRSRLSVSDETVKKWLSEWANSESNVIHYQAPFTGKLRVLEQSLDVVDFDRLEFMRNLLWKKLDLVRDYMETVPDSHKQDFMRSYFEHRSPTV